MNAPFFVDRHDAGRQLAVRVAAVVDAPPSRHPPLVLGLPRGGVPVAFEVARLLSAPLDVLPVRKLGVPGHEEYAMGAIAALDGEVVRMVDRAYLERDAAAALLFDDIVRMETAELHRRRRAYRGDRPPLDVTDLEVVLVDDGLATGATMLAAVQAVREGHAQRIIVAAPVGAVDTCARLRAAADACLCVVEAAPLDGVGAWYRDFGPTSDEEVIALLAEADRRHAHRLQAAHEMARLP